LRGVPVTFASPKSSTLACPRGHKIFAGLMSRLRCLARAPHPVRRDSMRGQQRIQFHRAAADQMFQRCPADIHGDERLAALLVNLVNGADFDDSAPTPLRLPLKAVNACGSLATSSGRNFRATKRAA